MCRTIAFSQLPAAFDDFIQGKVNRRIVVDLANRRGNYGSARKARAGHDDSKFVRKTFASILSASFACARKPTARRAGEAIRTDPSIVMCSPTRDAKLDGFELLERIRTSSDPRIRELPVVAISGNREEANKKRAASAGGERFHRQVGRWLRDPVAHPELLRLVRTSRELEASQQALAQSVTHDRSPAL